MTPFSNTYTLTLSALGSDSEKITNTIIIVTKNRGVQRTNNTQFVNPFSTTKLSLFNSSENLINRNSIKTINAFGGHENELCNLLLNKLENVKSILSQFHTLIYLFFVFLDGLATTWTRKFGQPTKRTCLLAMLLQCSHMFLNEKEKKNIN